MFVVMTRSRSANQTRDARGLAPRTSPSFRCILLAPARGTRCERASRSPPTRLVACRHRLAAETVLGGGHARSNCRSRAVLSRKGGWWTCARSSALECDFDPARPRHRHRAHARRTRGSRCPGRAIGGPTGRRRLLLSLRLCPGKSSWDRRARRCMGRPFPGPHPHLLFGANWPVRVRRAIRPTLTLCRRVS